VNTQLCRAASAEKVLAFNAETDITRNEKTEWTKICGH